MLRRSDPAERAATLSFWMLSALLVILWIAGGASRADVSGQAFVRFWAWGFLIAAVLFLPRPDWASVRGPAVVLGLAALLVSLQLIPLPPLAWHVLPDRAIFVEADRLIGMTGVWRPLSISPDGTANAIQSLIVPLAVLVLAAHLTISQHRRVVVLIVGLVLAGAILGLVQFSGTRISNPFINEQAPAISANFANRNHFALSLSIGCVLSATWAFGGAERRWKIAFAFVLMVLFALMILATGSRTGILLGVLAIVLSFAMVRHHARRAFGGVSTRALAGLAAVAVAMLAAAVVLSASLDRAASLSRVTTLEGESEIRGRIWPVVIDAAQRYFPAGSGFGTFDKAFRISEPDHLLRPTYVNQAHSDWLQILLEGGLAGAALLGGALIWYVARSCSAWRPSANPAQLHARAGFVVILLVLVASIPDYPGRTPMIMALLMIAAVWLARIARHPTRPDVGVGECDSLPSLNPRL